jgi:precorrin-2/cobalt-factor-2 C20-methyltransferase
VLDRLGRLEGAVYIERASLPNQRIRPLAEIETAPYFSMALVAKKR